MQLSKNLIDLTERNNRYHSLNGKSILNLPLQVPVCMSIDSFLKDLFEKYNNLLCDQMNLFMNKYCISKDELEQICKSVKYVCDNIIEALDNYKNGRIASAFFNIKRAVRKGKLQVIDLQEAECKTFYRMRSGLGHKDEKEFYHVPFDKLHLTESYRFSMQGFPCLYIGYTEDVCKKELRKDGSVIQLYLKNDVDKKCTLIDLTWFEASHNEHKKDSFLISFPLIAACYIIPNYCKSINKECVEIEQKFKEQYVIPQLVSAYIRETYKVDGIRYYTTRDENLDTQTTDGMNIALFANYDRNRLKDNNRKYDENITDKLFEFSNPHDVKI